MRLLVLAAALLVFSGHGIPASLSAEDVVKRTTEQVLARMQLEHGDLSGDLPQLYAIVEELVLPRFGLPPHVPLGLGESTGGRWMMPNGNNFRSNSGSCWYVRTPACCSSTVTSVSATAPLNPWPRGNSWWSSSKLPNRGYQQPADRIPDARRRIRMEGRRRGDRRGEFSR